MLAQPSAPASASVSSATEVLLSFEQMDAYDA